MVFMPDQICMCNLHQTTRFVIFKLKKFASAYIDTAMKFCTRSRISFGLKTRMNLLQNDLYENECHFGIMSRNTEK